jgi:mono/diheme cytochrome c family protein
MKNISVPYYLFLALLAAWLGTASTGTAQEKAVKEVQARPTTSIVGKDLYHSYCAVCHGTDAKGNGPAADSLKARPTDLTQISKNNGGKFPDQKVLDIIKGDAPAGAHGNKDMAPWGRIFSQQANPSTSQQRVYSLLNYINSIQAK